jgi:hypothetical protein
MGFGIDQRARSRKAKGGLRSLLGKAPDAAALGDRLVRLSRRMFKHEVLDATPRRVTLALHPNASPVRLVVLPDGDLEVTADTSAIGPGYHSEILARLAPVLDELEYVWDGEPVDPQASMTGWLAGELARGVTAFGMPADRSFRVAAEIATAMGPRDAAWRDAVISDPRRGADAFAWWDRGPGRVERSRALLAIAFEVPWREPLDGDERALMKRVDEDLVAARRADRELALPYPEWAELLDHLGVDDEHAARVRKRAGDAAATLGYRRCLMEVELAGWTFELGGGFVGSWDEDGTRWTASDGDRVVELESLTAAEEADSARLLAVAPEVHPVIARSVDGARHARAEAFDDGDVHFVYGLVAQAPHVAILTCRGAVADEAWALAIWRSLRR